MPRIQSPQASRIPGWLLALVLFAVSSLGAAPPPADSGPARDPSLSFSLREPVFRDTEGAFFKGFSLVPPVLAEGESPALPALTEGTRMKKKWGRASLEFGALFSYSAINYWRKYALFIEDWQYELTCRDQYKRFFTTEALKFDSNSFYLNWSHSLAGAVYYQFARTNYLSWLESWIFSTGGSLLWEYGVEWREVVSVNDNVFTGLGSYSIGEAWYQTARYLAAQPQLALRALSFINPFLKINRWFDRKNPASKAWVAPGWHDFEISVGARRLARPGRDRQDSLYFSLRTEIVAFPDFGKPGVVRTTVRDFFSSELAVDLARGGDRDVDEALARGWAEEDLAGGGWADEVNFSTRVVNWALYRQNIDELSRGTSFSLGLGSAFMYFRKTPALLTDTGILRVRRDDFQFDKPRFFRDKISAVHLAGPVMDWRLYGRKLSLRFSAEAYVDFALVNSLAFNEYSEDHDIAGMKTTLLHYGYYYALGASLKGRFDLEWRNFRFRSLASCQAWDSVEGLDRFQSEIEDDRDVDDSRVRYLVGADWKIPRLPFGLFFTYEGIRRRGRFGGVEARGLEKRSFAGLTYFF